MLEALWRAVWQGSLLVALVWVVGRFARGLSPKVRGVLWWVASLKFVVALIGVAVPLAVLPARESFANLDEIPQVRPESQLLQPTNPAPSSSAPFSDVPTPSVDPTQWLIALWLLGAGIGLVKVGRDAWQLSRVVQHSESLADGPIGEAARLLGIQMGVSAAPRVAASRDVTAPMVVGFLHPTILVPKNWTSELDDSQIRMALAHELAHIRRGDLLLGIVPELAQTLFFFLPTVWLARREWIAEREAACDADAIRVTGESPKAYGGLLL